MKIIKYRQPVRDNNGNFIEWFYWGFIDGQWNHWAIHQNGQDTRGESQQFAGLKDDIGQEIYEGDIKKHHDYADGGHDTYVVKYGEYPGGYGWFEENVKTKSIHSVNLRTGKVIGNKFQNPDLLK